MVARTNDFPLRRPHTSQASCEGCTGGVLWADYLTPSSSASVCSGALCIFNYAAQSTTSLAKLSVDFPVNLKPAKTVELYELQDAIVLRNSSRS